MRKSNAGRPKGKDQNKDMKRKGCEKEMQRDLRERIKRRRIIWVEFLNKDMKRKG